MNQTIVRFGYPQTLIAEYDHWVVMLREKQIAAACLILACKEEALAFGDLSAEAFADLRRVTGDIERNLKRWTAFDKINYLMLMMVDPHVHFHVLPRHSGERKVAGIRFVDASWPGAPNLASAVALDPEQNAALLSFLRQDWIRSA